MTGIKGAAHAGPNLPAIDLWNGHALTLDICEPGFVYAARITNLDGDGLSWRYVYRTPVLRPTDSFMLRVLDWLGGALQIGETETVVDEMMMSGKGLLSLYET